MKMDQEPDISCSSASSAVWSDWKSDHHPIWIAQFLETMLNSVNTAKITFLLHLDCRSLDIQTTLTVAV